MREQTIYRRGSYKVVPLIQGYVVKDGWGRTIAPFTVDDVDGAIDFVDELATGIGERVA